MGKKNIKKRRKPNPLKIADWRSVMDLLGGLFAPEAIAHIKEKRKIDGEGELGRVYANLEYFE